MQPGAFYLPPLFAATLTNITKLISFPPLFRTCFAKPYILYVYRSIFYSYNILFFNSLTIFEKFFAVLSEKNCVYYCAIKKILLLLQRN